MTSAGGSTSGASGGSAGFGAGGTTAVGGGSGSKDGGAVDAPSVETAPPDTAPIDTASPFKMPVLNYTEYEPPFDPTTIPGIRPLFDGETLTGWNYDPKVWSVVNNYMKCTSDNTFAGTLESFSEFRLFVSSRQVSGQYGQTGYGFYGTQPPKGQWNGEAWKFVYLVGPTCIWWDYVTQSNDGTLNCQINMEKAPYNLPRQGKPGPWWQHEFLFSMSKGTIRGALNGVDFLNFKLSAAAHKDRAAFTSTPIGFLAHFTNTEVRYKDVWIEVNPREPDKLYSVKK